MGPKYRLDNPLVIASILTAVIGLLAVLFFYSSPTSIFGPFFWLSNLTLSLLGVPCNGFGCYAVLLPLSAGYIAGFCVLAVMAGSYIDKRILS
ncbi:hypothetical protein ACFR9U_12625 [Halorientalis brevis]|uniref:Uncharacterized protein n=1 Tax=Halorientalis brevis TaxID=1126241 RepID=A0ABD6CCV4_9EURY|nr:hypothetical protein [Halorientalis brevis]